MQLLNIESEQQQNALNTAHQNYRAHLLDLKMLAGVTDTTMAILNPIQLDKISADPVNSGFTKKYSLDSLSLAEERKVFNLRYKPQFDFYSSAGLNTVYAPDIPNRFGLQLGLRFVQPIYDGKQKQLN
jgi:hypothetical protein